MRMCVRAGMRACVCVLFCLFVVAVFFCCFLGGGGQNFEFRNLWEGILSFFLYILHHPLARIMCSNACQRKV